MEVVNQPLGVEGKLELKFEDGKAKLLISHNHSSGSVGVVVEQDAEYFLRKLAEAIPGAWDDAALGIVISLVKAL